MSRGCLFGDSYHVVFACELLPPSLCDSFVAPHVHERDILPGSSVRDVGLSAVTGSLSAGHVHVEDFPAPQCSGVVQDARWSLG